MADTPTRPRPVLVVDFDGTIAHWARRGFPAIGKPIDGAQRFLRLLRSEGWKIIVHSCRNGAEQEASMAAWLAEHDIPYDEINRNSDYPWADGKPVGDVYLDDRGLRFDGRWDRAYEQVQEFLYAAGHSRLTGEDA